MYREEILLNHTNLSNCWPHSLANTYRLKRPPWTVPDAIQMCKTWCCPKEKWGKKKKARNPSTACVICDKSKASSFPNVCVCVCICGGGVGLETPLLPNAPVTKKYLSCIAKFCMGWESKSVKPSKFVFHCWSSLYMIKWIKVSPSVSNTFTKVKKQNHNFLSCKWSTAMLA